MTKNLTVARLPERKRKLNYCVCNSGEATLVRPRRAKDPNRSVILDLKKSLTKMKFLCREATQEKHCHKNNAKVTQDVDTGHERFERHHISPSNSSSRPRT
jgi:hypothetical protein